MKNILNNLPKLISHSKKRLGRGLGSGKGAKSGRGTTRHQKARESIPLHFEGGQSRMVKKFPLLRGKGRNNSMNLKPLLITLKSLNIYKNDEKVSADTLIKKGLMIERARKSSIKILANGKLEKKLTVLVPVSKQAKLEIEKAGGKVEL